VDFRLFNPARRGTISCETPEGPHRLVYKEWGNPDSKRLAICAHGLTRNAADFAFLAVELAKAGWRVVAYDVVGRGESEWLENKTRYGYPQYALDAEKVVAHFVDRGPPDLEMAWIGSSMGGVIGMMLLAKLGNRSPIKRFIMNDIGPYVPGSAVKRLQTYLLKNRSASYSARLAARQSLVDAYQPVFGPTTDEAYWDYLTDNSFRFNEQDHLYRPHYDPGIFDSWVSVVEFPDMKLWPAFNEIQVPILVLHGVNSDLLPNEIARQMEASSRPSRPVTVKDFPSVGHLPPLYQRSEMEPILQFLG